VPVAGTPGSCKCSANGSASPSAAPSPEFANAGPPPALGPATGAAGSAPAAVEVTPPPAGETTVEYAQLAEANQEHPITPEKTETPIAPPSAVPVYTAVLPPLMYNAGGPAPPPASSEDMVLLVREARASRDWEFSGHVEAPEFAKAMQHALGEGNTATKKAPASAADANPGAGAAADDNLTASNEEPAPRKRHGGFWASLKRVFGG
jgi:hypothetical protein